MEFSVQLISALDSTLRLAAPLVLCAMAGLTVVLGIAWFRRGGQTPSLGSDERFGPLT